MKKVLIIEDEKLLRDMYAHKISERGFEVFLADSAEEGLKVLKEKKPDLVLLDILLPAKNGTFVLKELKTSLDNLKPKVIVFSNYDDPVIKKKALDLGAEEYLIKTQFTPNGILEEIEKYLK
ncbi:response regulator [bacterium]|nr:response regulator [bacterium]